MSAQSTMPKSQQQYSASAKQWWGLPCFPDSFWAFFPCTGPKFTKISSSCNLSQHTQILCLRIFSIHYLPCESEKWSCCSFPFKKGNAFFLSYVPSLTMSRSLISHRCPSTREQWDVTCSAPRLQRDSEVVRLFFPPPALVHGQTQ